MSLIFKTTKKYEVILLPGLFIVARLILFLSLPLESIRGYGDYWNFYHQASLGIPFFEYWTEFPPVFPFLSFIIFKLTGGSQHSYEYLLAFLFTLAQAGSLYLFLLLAKQIYPEEQIQRKAWVYFVLTVGLFYGWGYLDPLVVFSLLAALYFLTKILKSRTLRKGENWFDLKLGLLLSIGTLVKWFPILVLPAVWKVVPIRRALKITVITLGNVAVVWGGLYLLSPEMTKASLISQGNKGSWETVWALIDGNLHTGNFNPQINRLVPRTASYPNGNPAHFPPWLTLLFFGAGGLGIFLQIKLENTHQIIALFGITLVVFLLWSPGYSPQWVLYLLPMTLLAMPNRESVLMSVVLVLISLLEWPILLSRGYFLSLRILIPLRVFLLILLGTRFGSVLKYPTPKS